MGGCAKHPSGEPGTAKLEAINRKFDANRRAVDLILRAAFSFLQSRHCDDPDHAANKLGVALGLRKNPGR